RNARRSRRRLHGPRRRLPHGAELRRDDGLRRNNGGHPGAGDPGRGSPVGPPLRRLHRGWADHAGEHQYPAPARAGPPGGPRPLRRGAGSHQDDLSNSGIARRTSLRRMGGMSSIVSSGASVRLKRDPAEIRRRGLGISLFVLAGIIFILFARGTAGDAWTTFLLTAAPAPPVPPIRLLVLPTVLVLGALCAALGLLQ